MVAIKYVDIVSPKRAEGVVADIYKQARREMGLLPEAVTLFSPSSDVGVASWATFRELMVATGQTSKMAKEAVAAVVSRKNSCPYCVDAHTIMLYGTGERGFAEQLLNGVAVSELESSLRPLAEWAEGSATKDTAAVGVTPFRPVQLPELLGTVVEFHFLNRMLNVLVGQTFLPGPSRAHRVVRPVTGMLLSRKVRATNKPGQAAGFDFDAPPPLPKDLAWAAPNPSVAAALAGMAAATESASSKAASAAARQAVAQAIAAWTGEVPSLGLGWLDEILAGVAPGDQPTVRLALLTAFASYRVTDKDVAAYRADHGTDADLIGLLSWASFSAARRVGAWTAAAAGTSEQRTAAGSSD